MNRTGTVPQSLRGMPGGFGGGQQSQHTGRSGVNRLPNGKLAIPVNNGSGWAFGGVGPMSSGGIQNPVRQLGGTATFAQSLSGSTPATPLDLSKRKSLRAKSHARSTRSKGSTQPEQQQQQQQQQPAIAESSRSQDVHDDAEKNKGGMSYQHYQQRVLACKRNWAQVVAAREFPQLSNNAQLSGANQPSMWGGQAARNLSGPTQRTPSSSITQQSQQDDLFSPVPRLSSSQNSFRFGSQASIGQSQPPQPSGGDEFPPLNRNGNGDIGQERGASMMSGLAFGSQVAGSSSSAQANRAGNGLLNAVTASARTTEVRSPVGTRPADAMSSILDDDARRKSTFREDGPSGQPSIPDAAGPPTEMRNPVGTIGNDASAGKGKEVAAEAAPAGQDPLAGMPEADKWGIKGFLTLMAKYPSYSALVHGMNPSEFGLDLNSDVPFSEQSFSLFDHTPPKPPLPKFTLPECYTVRNTQPIEQKMPNFTEETLLYMFYANPQDKHQFLAARELYARGWRWHKTLRIWLTKDAEMQPVMVAPDTERGYYVVWNTTTWARERRELLLMYHDLESLPDTTTQPQP